MSSLENQEGAGARVRVAAVGGDGRVAVIQQVHRGSKIWLLPGGGVSSGETLDQAAIREVVEETGLAVDRLTFVGLRETLIVGHVRTYEFFFIARASGCLAPGFDPERVEQIITGSQWLYPSEFAGRGVVPSFAADLLEGSEARYVKDVLTLPEYLERYGSVPTSPHGRELAYVMLKPDALEHGLVERLIGELTSLGCEVIAQVSRMISPAQLNVVYFDFSHEPARELVFGYLTGYPTHHLVLAGAVGLHERLNAAKGRTGSGEGLRGKYVKWYTALSAEDFALWRRGNHPRQRVVDLEMFCRNLLHVAPNAAASARSIECIFS